MRRGAVAVVICAVASLLAPGLASSAGAASRLPDLTVSREGPSSIYASARFSDTITVTNLGNAPSKGVVVYYRPALGFVAASSGVGIAPIRECKSGRGGGCRTIGYEFRPTLAGGVLAPRAAVSFTITVQAPSYYSRSLEENVRTGPPPPQLQRNLVSHTATDTLPVLVPAPPQAPTELQASRVGDLLKVGWTAASATSAAITSSTITLIPQGETGAPVVTSTVQGPEASATLGPVLPQTTYLVTVVNSDAAGPSPASAPLSYTTAASTVVPAAPTEVRAYWGNTANPPQGFLQTSWGEGAPGDSPIDQYQVAATPSEPEVATAQLVSAPGSARGAELALYDEMPWSVAVRAHNAAGWGPWSPSVVVAGI